MISKTINKNELSWKEEWKKPAQLAGDPTGLCDNLLVIYRRNKPCSVSVSVAAGKNSITFDIYSKMSVTISCVHEDEIKIEYSKEAKEFGDNDLLGWRYLTVGIYGPQFEVMFPHGIFEITVLGKRL